MPGNTELGLPNYEALTYVTGAQQILNALEDESFKPENTHNFGNQQMWSMLTMNGIVEHQKMLHMYLDGRSVLVQIARVPNRFSVQRFTSHLEEGHSGRVTCLSFCNGQYGVTIKPEELGKGLVLGVKVGESGRLVGSIEQNNGESLVVQKLAREDRYVLSDIEAELKRLGFNPPEMNSLEVLREYLTSTFGFVDPKIRPEEMVEQLVSQGTRH